MTDPTETYEFIPCAKRRGQIGAFLCSDGSMVGMLRRADDEWFVMLSHRLDDGFDEFPAAVHSLDGAARHLVQLHEDRMMQVTHRHAKF